MFNIDEVLSDSLVVQLLTASQSSAAGSSPSTVLQGITLDYLPTWWKSSGRVLCVPSIDVEFEQFETWKESLNSSIPFPSTLSVQFRCFRSVEDAFATSTTGDIIVLDRGTFSTPGCLSIPGGIAFLGLGDRETMLKGDDWHVLTNLVSSTEFLIANMVVSQGVSTTSSGHAGADLESALWNKENEPLSVGIRNQFPESTISLRSRTSPLISYVTLISECGRGAVVSSDSSPIFVHCRFDHCACSSLSVLSFGKTQFPPPPPSSVCDSKDECIKSATRDVMDDILSTVVRRLEIDEDHDHVEDEDGGKSSSSSSYVMGMGGFYQYCEFESSLYSSIECFGSVSIRDDSVVEFDCDVDRDGDEDTDGNDSDVTTLSPVFENCKIVDSKGKGMIIGGKGAEINVFNCEFENNIGCHVANRKFAALMIRESKMTGGGMCGVLLDGGSNADIINNEISNTTLSGIQVSGKGTCAEIIGNVVKSTGEFGIDIFENAKARIVSNSICDIVGGGGINVDGYSVDVLIKKNSISGCDGSGVVVADHSSAKCIGNDIFENSLVNVTALEYSNLDLKRNKIHGSRSGGVFIHEDALVAATKNEIFENNLSGIEVITRGIISAVDNKIFANKANGIWVYAGGVGSIEYNHIFDNGSAGIEIDAACCDSVIGNDISGHGQGKDLVIKKRFEEGRGSEGIAAAGISFPEF